MCVGVHRDTDIAVSHQILEGLRVHPGACHVGAVGVSADMRGNVRQPYFASEYFFIIYVTMILSGMVSSWFHQFKSPAVPCLGASGALYGIFGVYLVAAFYSIGISAMTGIIPIKDYKE